DLRRPVNPGWAKRRPIRQRHRPPMMLAIPPLRRRTRRLNLMNRRRAKSSDSMADDAAGDPEEQERADLSDAGPMIPAGATSEPDGPIRIVVEARAHGWRVDHYLCRLYPNFSRAAWQRTIGE